MGTGRLGRLIFHIFKLTLQLSVANSTQSSFPSWARCPIRPRRLASRPSVDRGLSGLRVHERPRRLPARHHPPLLHHPCGLLPLRHPPNRIWWLRSPVQWLLPGTSKPPPSWCRSGQPLPARPLRLPKRVPRGRSRFKRVGRSLRSGNNLLCQQAKRSLSQPPQHSRDLLPLLSYPRAQPGPKTVRAT